jgi:hypothetical protein
MICRWWFCRFDLLLVCLRLCCCSLIFFFFGFIDLYVFQFLELDASAVDLYVFLNHVHISLRMVGQGIGGNIG